jgi:DNA-binding CsgD family transcriptional regulator
MDDLLEREMHLAELHRAVGEAAGGRGRTVLISGEAGIGKTSLIERFSEQMKKHALVLWGACEALFTARPLGPFYDIAHELGGEVLAGLRRNARPMDLFHAVLVAVRSHEQPSILVIEDAHWADHATLDFIKFLARRIPKCRALLLLTYRDDEIGADHPLATTLAAIPADARVRIRLPNLSREAVERLARQTGKVLPDLYRVTAGNPLFVTELLREGTQGVTSTVRDAVLARAQGLSPPARALLDFVSVSPDRLELEIVAPMLGDSGDPLQDCTERALLRLDGEHVSFRHELARLAVEAALPPLKRIRLNRQLLDALRDLPADVRRLARLVHHAVAAKDPDEILRYAPQAARTASERGAHREAAALLEAALPYVDRLPARQRAEFHEARVAPNYAVGRGAEAMHASDSAYRLWDELHDNWAKGRNLVRRLKLPWPVEATASGGPVFGSIVSRRQAVLDAIVLLEPFPPGPDLALAYATLARLSPLGEPDATASYREKAVELADRCCDDEDLAEVFFGIGLAEWCSCGSISERTIARLMRHSVVARSEHLVRAHHYKAENAFAVRDLHTAASAVAEGLRVAEDWQLDDYWAAHHLRITEAAIATARGDWTAADAAYQAVFARGTVPPFLASLFRLRGCVFAARRGLSIDTGCVADALGREATFIRKDVYALHRANAELAWLIGKMDEARRSARIAWHIAEAWRHSWILGEAALLRQMVGDPVPIPGGLAGPYALQLRGDWRGAAEHWKQLGCPYDHALALSCGDEEGQRESVRMLEFLGAKGVADRVREHMRERGICQIPRGPNRRTTSNPSHLTDRELQVLGLLAEGLSNAAIAKRLRRSVKTVDHHVAAIIAKLGAAGRLEAVTIARRRSLVA